MGMAYDFETLIDRRGTDSVKWDFQEQLTGHSGLLPLWVADMDFAAPKEIMDAIRRRVEHGIFGYVREPDSYFEAAAGWLNRRQGWNVQREWMIASPGVLAGLAASILALTEPGDGVVIQPPVYYPFALRIAANGRRVVENPLQLNGDRWEMDLEGLERVIDARTRMLILCSPHNPAARVWERESLARLAGICHRRGIIIVSDEIHGDLVMPGFRHLPIASLSRDCAENTITLVAATKTFNLAGLGGSITIIPNSGLRARVEAVQRAVQPGAGNVIGIAAAEAGWRFGETWLEELLLAIKGNYDFLSGCLAQHIPSVKVFPLEGTYLALLDMKALGLEDAQLKEWLLRDCRVWMDEGSKFGKGGMGMQRMNLACPRSILAETLDRMKKGLASRQSAP